MNKLLVNIFRLYKSMNKAKQLFQIQYNQNFGNLFYVESDDDDSIIVIASSTERSALKSYIDGRGTLNKSVESFVK
jgi:hypothetical protein